MRLDIDQMLIQLDGLAAEVSHSLGARFPEAVRIFAGTLKNTLQTTVRPMADGTVYVITGDIPAMWLRDSAAQVRPYLALASRSGAFADLLVGVNRRQFQYVNHDPYANAFNQSADGSRWDHSDKTEMTPLVWERKFELDSLCYPIALAWDILHTTGRSDHLDDEFRRACRSILAAWRAETDHQSLSKYRFERDGDGLRNSGLGEATAVTGLLWAGFRPSDDACVLNFNVPGNAFSAVAADKMAVMLEQVEPELAAEARRFGVQIREALHLYGRVSTDEFGDVYAYEVDGLGGHVLMDDANIPSLLSLPYLGFCTFDDPIYAATRRLVLSEANPFYYSGKWASGIGSPHQGPQKRVWPLSLAMQALTTDSADERATLLDVLATTHDGTDLMHEEFHVDDPSDYTRPWFAWANSLFSEAMLVEAGLLQAGHTPLKAAAHLKEANSSR